MCLCANISNLLILSIRCLSRREHFAAHLQLLVDLLQTCIVLAPGLAVWLPAVAVYYLRLLRYGGLLRH